VIFAFGVEINDLIALLLGFGIPPPVMLIEAVFTALLLLLVGGLIVKLLIF
jgi:hypothetical protein